MRGARWWWDGLIPVPDPDRLTYAHAELLGREQVPEPRPMCASKGGYRGVRDEYHTLEGLTGYRRRTDTPHGVEDEGVRVEGRLVRLQLRAGEEAEARLPQVLSARV